MTTQIHLSRPSRFSAFKAIILCLLAGAACISFVGCGSDTESSMSPIGEITSSSSDEVIEGIGKFSSSSNKVEPDSSSSSSVTLSESNGYSSSVVTNESSSSVQSSLSEVAAVSSSSDVVAESSSSEKSSSSEAESSSSVESSSSEVPSSSSVIESSSSVAESSSSDEIVDSSSSESIVTSSSVMESSSSDMIVGCKTPTEDKCVYGELYDERDEKTYKTVVIGTQEWMAENLNYETAGSSCYDYKANNCAKYGRLYTWATAMDSAGGWGTNGKDCGYSKTCSPAYPVRGICPEGWHLPAKAEWMTLFDAVGGQTTSAGTVLKSSSGWNRVSTGTATIGVEGTDAYGFSALPAGLRYHHRAEFDYEGSSAFFWSASERSEYETYNIELGYGYRIALIDHYLKNYWFSVRCIKDN